VVPGGKGDPAKRIGRTSSIKVRATGPGCICPFTRTIRGSPVTLPCATPGNADWAAVCEGYRARVDRTGARVWHEAFIAFPQARVIHTARPEEDWWTSYSTTLEKFFTPAPGLPLPPHLHAFFGWMTPFFTYQLMGDHRVKEKAIAAHRPNNRKVREMTAADRLLVFNVADGWGPLCAFPGLRVQGVPFSRTNPRQEFQERFGGEPDVQGAAAAGSAGAGSARAEGPSGSVTPTEGPMLRQGIGKEVAAEPGIRTNPLSRRCPDDPSGGRSEQAGLNGQGSRYHL